jgi:hypothetical protein
VGSRGMGDDPNNIVYWICVRKGEGLSSDLSRWLMVC